MINSNNFVTFINLLLQCLGAEQKVLSTLVDSILSVLFSPLAARRKADMSNQPGILTSTASAGLAILKQKILGNQQQQQQLLQLSG